MSFNPEGFERLLTILGRATEPLRVGYGTTNFQQVLVPAEGVSDFIDQAVTHQVNVWYEINPTSYLLEYGRSNANNITRLAALWADIDFKPKQIADASGATRPGGMGDLPSALDLVHDLSGALGLEPNAIVFTGGGIQPYWVVDNLWITDDNRADVKLLLKRWKSLVTQLAAAHGGGIDNVFDLARILRVPGTNNHKAEYGTPRPVSVEFAEQGAGWLNFEEINQILDDHGITGEAALMESTTIVSAMGDWEWAEHDCGFAHDSLREIDVSVPQSRHHWALKYSAIVFGMVRNGCVTEATFYQLRDALISRFTELCATQTPIREATAKEISEFLAFGQQKAETWTKAKLADELRGHTHTDLEREIAARQAAAQAPMPQPKLAPVTSINTGMPLAPPPMPTDPIPQPGQQGNLAVAVMPRPAEREARLRFATMTDTGNAERLADAIAGEFIHVPGIGWHVFEDGRYKLDESGMIVEKAKSLVVNIAQFSVSKEMQRWAQKSLSAGAINASVRLAQTVPSVSVSPTRLDASPLELCTPGGIVDLATGIIRPADPATDFHTLRTTVAPDWSVPTPMFTSFMQWALVHPERIAYMQRMLGIAAIGEVRHHVFPILLGPGSNGKTTTTDIASGVFGQYAATMPQKFLVEKSGNSHPTEIARLRGIRLAISNEVPPNAKFDEELVKTLTGETRLTGRFMGENFFDFVNTTTHLMTANHLPSVPVGGKGFWRRVRKIDYKTQLEEGYENPNLVTDIIEQEAAGILAWIVDGAKQVVAAGEQAPQSIMAATHDYRMEEDTLARFMEETLVKVDGIEVSREAAYFTYRRWAQVQGVDRPLTAIAFSREIVTMYPRGDRGTKHVFTNLALATMQGVED